MSVLQKTQLDLPTKHTDLGELAESINREHSLFEKAALSAVEHAGRAGELLIKAKCQIRHGGWLSWIEANCSFGGRTAQGYMRVARRIAELSGADTQRVAHLPLRGLLAEFSERKPVAGSGASLDWLEEWPRDIDELMVWVRRATALNDALWVQYEDFKREIRDDDSKPTIERLLQIHDIKAPMWQGKMARVMAANRRMEPTVKVIADEIDDRIREIQEYRAEVACHAQKGDQA